MKIDKKVRAIPWPEPWRHKGSQQFSVTLAWPVVDGERLLVATFVRNLEKEQKWRTYKPDFRLVCSKKQNRVAVLYRDSQGASRHSLERALNGFHTGPEYCYPEISEKDERTLLRWLGVHETPNHGMPDLSVWTEGAVRAEETAEREARGELEDDDVYLCPEELPQGLEDYIRRTMLPEDRVLLYKKGNVRGVCFQCCRKVTAMRGQRFRQSQLTHCPNCGAEVLAILEDSAQFKAENIENVVTLQRGSDEATVFLRQWRLLRDFSAQWRDIPGQLLEVARYAVRGSRVAKWQQEGKATWYMCVERYRLNGWTRMKNVSQVYDGTYYFYLPPDWREQVSGTSLRYVDLEGYLNGPGRDRRGKNPVRFLLDWVRYPAVEKLWKAGYAKAVYERVNAPKKEFRNAVNWRKDSIREAVGFPFRLLKTWTPGEWTMERFQRGKDVWALVKQGKLREVEAEGLLRADTDLEQVGLALGHASLHKILRYLEDGRDVQTWRDYLRDCETLGLDLDDRAVLFPGNLDAAHQGTISQIEYKKDPAQWEAFSRRLGGLKKLAWSADGLLIRPPVDAGDLVAEGSALIHCVGRYVGDMAKGKTTILFIRRAEEPDKPFYTLEWRGGQVIQCRTKNNKPHTQNPAVFAFVEAWKTHLKKKVKRKEVS